MEKKNRKKNCVLQNTVDLNFKKLQSLLNTWGSHLLRPLEALTFWIASQVGKISNEAHLHLADSVHTPFVWREWFPPGLLAGPLCCSRLQGRGSTQLQTCVSPAHVTASWLTTHATRFLVLSLHSPAIYTRSPATVCVFFFPQLHPSWSPHTISFKAHLITANLEHMSECIEPWIEQLGIHLRDSKQSYIASHFSHCQMNVIIFYFCHY